MQVTEEMYLAVVRGLLEADGSGRPARAGDAGGDGRGAGLRLRRPGINPSGKPSTFGEKEEERDLRPAPLAFPWGSGYNDGYDL